MATAQLTPVQVLIRKLLIATDFSPCSSTALDFGLHLAKTCNGTAYIAFVVPNEPYLLAGPDAYVAAKDAATRDLEELETELKRRACGEYHLYLLEGDVAQALLNFAREKEVDLIVLGTHGRSALPKAMLGSVSERVFRHSLLPVLTLGPGVRVETLHVEPREILVAADFTPASQRAARYAVALAQEHRARLTLLHVVDPRQWQHVPDQAVIERGIHMRLRELLGRDADALPCSVRVEAGAVVQTILEVARELGTDLLVMGVRASSGVLDRLMIPHAYQIVREAPCPVLTLREAKPDSD